MATYIVEDRKGNLLWSAPGWCLSPENTASCVKEAYRHGGIPKIRHHAHYIDSINWEIEAEERGDSVILNLPFGRFVIKARRARKGEMTSDVAFVPGGFGLGRIAEYEVDSPIVAVEGRISVDRFGEKNYTVQVSRFRYADGSYSGYMGSVIRELKNDGAQH